MPDVFINYRTGDGEKTAALLDQELSRRFGKDRVFRASKTIRGGQRYPQELMRGLQRSSLLLAVIGPDWSRFHTSLRNPEDWVRKEIVQAFTDGITVVPVLEGRKTDRLAKAPLPAELQPLADLQSVLLDTHDLEDGLRRIGDLVADLVPALRERDRDRVEPPDAEAGGAGNHAGDVRGPSVQAGRDIGGDVGGTLVKEPSGPVHAGRGDIYQNSRHESGGRHFSGTGLTYFENGDQNGGIQHRFGSPDSSASEDR